MTPSALKQLAAQYGVQATYRTNDGSRASASRESLTAILRALGAPISETGALPEGAHGPAPQPLWLEPVHVAWEGEPPTVAVHVPPDAADARVELQLTLETGEQHDGHATLDRRAPGSPRASDECTVAYRIALPALPRGYHRLSVRHKQQTHETLIVAAPRRCYDGAHASVWGLFAPVYALHDAGTLGAGSVRELREFGRLLAGYGGSLLGTLPMLATDADLDPSPYRPLSRLFWNEHYADISRLEIADALRDELRALAQTEIIDHARVASAKRRAFEAAAAVAPDDDPGDDERLTDYARFRAACERFGTGWRAWPERMRGGDIAPDDVDAGRERYHRFAQRLIAEQVEAVTREMRADGVELYLDLPLGVHPDGYDAWRFRSLFVEGCSAGAPPDGFFSLGQNWAFAPQHSEELRRSGYAYTIEVLRRHMRHAGLVRIDHVMGLHRLYVIPDGFEARDGAYLQYHADELYAIIALESQRNECAVVGENLGTVPGFINRALKTRGLHGMYVAEFEAGVGLDGQLRAPSADTVASMDTHDTATFAAFWEGRDIDERLARGLLHERDETAEREGRAIVRERVSRALDRGCANGGTGAVLREWLRFLGESRAHYVIANTEDFWLEPEPQNRPGTSNEYPNWRRRFAKSIESIEDDPGIARTLGALASARARTVAAERRRAV